MPNDFFNALSWYNDKVAIDNLFSLHRYLKAHGFSPIHELTHDSTMIWENCYKFQVTVTVIGGRIKLTF